MLASAQSRLASLQGFDQSSLTKAIGTVTGANQQISSVWRFRWSAAPGYPNILWQYNFSLSASVPWRPGSVYLTPVVACSFRFRRAQRKVQITSEIANLRLLMEGSLF